MKKSYKYLKKRNSKILNFSKNFFKWVGIYFAIVIIFLTGLLLFANFVDEKKQYCYTENTINLNTSSKKQLTDEDKHELDLVKKNLENFDYTNDINDKKFKKELYDFSKWNEICEPELIIINKKNPLKSNFKPDLKLCRGKQVSVLIEDNLENLLHDAYQNGIFLWVVSGYRTPEHQQYLYEKRVETELQKHTENGEEFTQEMAELYAERTVQKPYQSEHNTGLAVDFNNVNNDFKNSKEYAWLHENAYKYGFIERYQENWESTTGVLEEPWHLRYVGIKNAEDIKNSKMCLEEYIFQKLNFRKKC